MNKIATTPFHLVADEKDRETKERVIDVYAVGCPVARSIRDSRNHEQAGPYHRVAGFQKPRHVRAYRYAPETEER